MSWVDAPRNMPLSLRTIHDPFGPEVFHQKLSNKFNKRIDPMIFFRGRTSVCGNVGDASPVGDYTGALVLPLDV